MKTTTNQSNNQIEPEQGKKKNRKVFYTSDQKYNLLRSDLSLKGMSVSQWINRVIDEHLNEKPINSTAQLQ